MMKRHAGKQKLQREVVQKDSSFSHLERRGEVCYNDITVGQREAHAHISCFASLVVPLLFASLCESGNGGCLDMRTVGYDAMRACPQ